jgi:hypothetical protein
MSWLSDFIRRIIEAVVQWISRCIPPYEPAIWNNDTYVRRCNNCYNYACNIRTDTFAQPGFGSGNQYQQINCGDVGAGAVADGLAAIPDDGNCGCRDCCHKVALVIAPGPYVTDFHWYRLDRDGKWSHKPGQTAARNTDNSGNLITDPRTADRGPYTVFCGFYCVCKERKLTIGGSKPSWC